MNCHAGKLVDVEELVMPPGGTHQAPKPMVPVNRPVGQNDVGMIAWVLTLRTPECPQGRKVSVPSNCSLCLCGGPPCAAIACACAKDCLSPLCSAASAAGSCWNKAMCLFLGSSHADWWPECNRSACSD